MKNEKIENRSQPIFVNGATSKGFQLQRGVPQGSCLGPLLFLMYASGLFNVVEPHLPDLLLQMIPNFILHSSLPKTQMKLLQSQQCKTALMMSKNGRLPTS